MAAVCALLLTALPALAQEAFPAAADSVPARFDVGLAPNAAGISTLQGQETLLVQSYLVQTTQPGVSGLNQGFVKPSGTKFVVNGQPYYCSGTNAYYAALKWIMSDNEVAVMMKDHAARGTNVIRVFTHSFFDSVPGGTAMMPTFNSYNEDALKRVDLMLAAAAQNGIRVIMVMSNYWPFLGGELVVVFGMGFTILFF